MSLAVLHVSEPTDGGAAVVATSIAADQVRRGWRVGVAGPRDGFLLARAADAGAAALEWPAVGAPGPAVVGEARRLGRIIAGFDPDVVHLHSSKAGMVGRLVLRGRVPTIFQPHGWSFRVAAGWQRRAALRWERFAARWALTMTVSEAEHQRGLDAGVRGRYAVVPNGVDTERFVVVDDATRDRLREQLGLPGTPIAVSVGRQSVEKGHALLLDAWPAVRDEIAGAVVVLVGDGPLRPELEARRVEGARFVGEVDVVESWYATADVVVLPSWSEAMPLTVLEAMSCARSVVATAVDGACEALSGDDAGVCGAVVPIGDATSLASAIAVRLRDRDLAAREGANGRARVERDFSLTAWHDRVAELTRGLAGSDQA